jgi:hypothetical protein
MNPLLRTFVRTWKMVMLKFLSYVIMSTESDSASCLYCMQQFFSDSLQCLKYYFGVKSKVTVLCYVQNF